MMKIQLTRLSSKPLDSTQALRIRTARKFLREISLIFLVARMVKTMELFGTMSMKLNLELCIIQSIED